MKRFAPEGALVFAAFLYGSTFVIVQDALDDITPFGYLVIRFATGVLALAPFAVLALRRMSPATRRLLWRAGAISGALLFVSYATQTVGLQYTESSTSAFITGLYVVFTPLLAASFLRRRPTSLVMMGVVLTTLGLGLMSLQISEGGVVTVNLGDMLILLCAVSYAGQIVAVSRWAPDMDARVLTLQQFVVTFVIAGLLTTTEDVAMPSTNVVWIALGATVIGSSVYGIGVQVWAQQRISPTRAAVIYSMEAPFAALAGFLLADERFPARAWAGAALILTGMLIVEVRPGARTEA